MKYILAEKKGAIGHITFNDPDNMNALTPEAMQEIISVLSRYEEDRDIRVVVFTGSGKAFSAGGNYDFLKRLYNATPVDIKEAVYKNFAGGVKATKMFPKPTIAAVNGPAVGAGCELAIACDFRIVSERALFSEIWARLGVICPLGGMFVLPRLVGLSKATEMLMLGETVDGQEAVQIGLANQCVPHAQLEDEVRRWTEKIAAGAPLAMSAMKEGLRRGMESTLAREWEYNMFAQATLISSDDCKEGITSAIDKRAPVFQGN